MVNPDHLIDVPFLQAANYTPANRTTDAIRLWVVHDMEAPEHANIAERVAHYFAGTYGTPPRASAHLNVDGDSVTQSVRLSDVAWHAAGANHDGIGVEHAGYARQTRGEWLDAYGLSMLTRSAQLFAKVAPACGIPPVWLTVAQVADGRTKGICGHADVTAAFARGSHTDPGPNFPKDVYADLCRSAVQSTTPTDQLPELPMNHPVYFLYAEKPASEGGGFTPMIATDLLWRQRVEPAMLEKIDPAWREKRFKVPYDELMRIPVSR